MTTLLETDELVVSQKAKLIELTNQYEIHGSDGAELGYVQQEGQSGLRKMLRFVSSVDQFLTHRLSIYDSAHSKVLELTRPAKLFKSKITVEDGHGRKLGGIVQQNVFGKSDSISSAPSGRSSVRSRRRTGGPGTSIAVLLAIIWTLAPWSTGPSCAATPWPGAWVPSRGSWPGC